MSDWARYPSLRDRVVVVTGGGSGIGASIVEHFCRQKAKVHFLDVAEGVSRQLVERMVGDGLEAPRFHLCDVSDAERLQQVLRGIIEQAGAVDVLVNNAASDDRHKVEDVTPQYWGERLDVNLRHQFFASQAVAAGMRKNRRGSIINMGSSSWHVGNGDMPAYTTAKAGVEGLTRGLARSFGVDGIRVNCVVPGWIITERQQRLWLTPESKTRLLERQCLKEVVVADDVARMVLWLAADDSKACTGQNFVVDAGWI